MTRIAHAWISPIPSERGTLSSVSLCCGVFYKPWEQPWELVFQPTNTLQYAFSKLVSNLIYSSQLISILLKLQVISWYLFLLYSESNLTSRNINNLWENEVSDSQRVRDPFTRTEQWDEQMGSMVNSRATGCERHRQYSGIRKRHGGALEVSPQGQWTLLKVRKLP